MRRIDPISLPDYTGTKRGIILGELVLAALVPLIALVDTRDGRVSLLLIALLLAGVLVCYWAYLDSLEVAEHLRPLMGASLTIFSIISLCIYLVRSRGWQYGARAAGKALLLLAVMFLVSASVFQLLNIHMDGVGE